MSKNILNLNSAKGKDSVKTDAPVDPVKEAQEQALNDTGSTAEATEQVQQGQDRGKEPPVEVVAEVTEVKPEEVKKALEEKEPTPEPEEVVVKETTAPRSAKSISLTNLVPTGQINDPSIVRRPPGAQSRAASPEPMVSTTNHIRSTAFSSLIDKERVNGSASAVALISFLDRYIEVMAPRRITSSAIIVSMQEALLDNLLTVIERAPAKEFPRLWNIATMYVGEYKNSCFNPMYYSRGARDWKRDPSKFNTLTSLINLLQATATDPANVQKVVNINAVVGKGFSEDARQRMFAFYVK